MSYIVQRFEGSDPETNISLWIDTAWTITNISAETLPRARAEAALDQAKSMFSNRIYRLIQVVG